MNKNLDDQENSSQINLYRHIQYWSDKSVSQLKNNSLKGWETKIDDSVLFPVKSNYIFC